MSDDVKFLITFRCQNEAKVVQLISDRPYSLTTEPLILEGMIGRYPSTISGNMLEHKLLDEPLRSTTVGVGLQIGAKYGPYPKGVLPDIVSLAYIRGQIFQ